jgi:hypothetical protein
MAPPRPRPPSYEIYGLGGVDPGTGRWSAPIRPTTKTEEACTSPVDDVVERYEAGQPV